MGKQKLSVQANEQEKRHTANNFLFVLSLSAKRSDYIVLLKNGSRHFLLFASWEIRTRRERSEIEVRLLAHFATTISFSFLWNFFFFKSNYISLWSKSIVKLHNDIKVRISKSVSWAKMFKLKSLSFTQY